MSLKSGLRKSYFPVTELPTGTFFKPSPPDTALISDYSHSWQETLIKQADAIVDGNIQYFFAHQQPVGAPPNWFLNPFDQRSVDNPEKHWTELGDFDLNIGDIKIIWETSRFYWMPVLARAYAISGDPRYIQALNDWLNDWASKNPHNTGPNWKCGQETSIRLIHLLLTAYILKQYNQPTPELQQLVWRHLQRVEPNISYALAQDNNHGTSEASALYIGSAWLMHTGFIEPQLITYRDKGRRLLEDRIVKLIQNDGTFSQYSITYHRMVLDTVSWVLWNEKNIGLESVIRQQSRQKMEKALVWLETLIDESGDAPNFGPNDGSLICKLDSNDYRDFWPSIRLLKTLLRQPITSDKKIKDERLFWLGLDPEYTEKSHKEPRSLAHFPESGLIRIDGDQSWLLFHYPHYQFRPSHCDFLHVDLWHKGKNILRDSGSYSYNANADTQPGSAYFKSIQSHNTVFFDNNEPIPKISRFLYADWPRAEAVKADNSQKYCQARYRFRDQLDHQRSIQLVEDDTWLVTDVFDGNYHEVELRWRLIPADWEISTDTLTIQSSYARIIIKADAACHINLEQGFESRYYMDVQNIPVLVVKGNHTLKRIESYIELPN